VQQLFRVEQQRDPFAERNVVRIAIDRRRERIDVALLRRFADAARALSTARAAATSSAASSKPLLAANPQAPSTSARMP
jgi:hypothetical protein